MLGKNPVYDDSRASPTFKAERPCSKPNAPPERNPVKSPFFGCFGTGGFSVYPLPDGERWCLKSKHFHTKPNISNGKKRR